jgi:hypothetical protein
MAHIKKAAKVGVFAAFSDFLRQKRKLSMKYRTVPTPSQYKTN